MPVLRFPLWVRIASQFMRNGNDGLTRLERRHLARRYARTGGMRRVPPGHIPPTTETHAWVEPTEGRDYIVPLQPNGDRYLATWRDTARHLGLDPD